MTVATLRFMPIALRIVLIACVALGALAPSALAQGNPEPGVTVDPNSPAGKQYSLPVPQARKETQGSKSKKKSDGNAPLFGEGVTSGTTNSAPPATTTNSAPPATTTNSTPPPTSTPATSSSAATSSAKARARAKAKAKRAEARRKARARQRAAEKRRKAAAAAVTTTNNSPPPPSPQEVAKIAADSNDPSGGLGSSVLFGLIGLAVLVFGGAAGLLLRRRLQSSP